MKTPGDMDKFQVINGMHCEACCTLYNESKFKTSLVDEYIHNQAVYGTTTTTTTTT